MSVWKFAFKFSGAGGSTLFAIFTIFRWGAFVQIRMKHEWGTNWLEVPIKVEILARYLSASFSLFPIAIFPWQLLKFIKVQENRLVPQSLYMHGKPALSSQQVLLASDMWLYECSSAWRQNQRGGLTIATSQHPWIWLGQFDFQHLLSQ